MTSPPHSKPSGQDDKRMEEDTPSREGLDVTSVLRRAYERTVEEEVPSSMLDLLAQLN